MRKVALALMAATAASFLCHSASAKETRKTALPAAGVSVKTPHQQFLELGRVIKVFTNRKDGSRLMVVGPKPGQIEAWQKNLRKLRYSSHGNLNTVNENILFYQPSGSTNQFEYQMVTHVMKGALMGRTATGAQALDERYALTYKGNEARVACPDDAESLPLVYVQDDAAHASIAALWDSGTIRLSVNYPPDQARIERVFVAAGNDLFIQSHTWATDQRFVHHIHHGQEIEVGEAILDRGISPPALNSTKIGSITPLYEYNSIPTHAHMADVSDANPRRGGGTGVFSLQTPSGGDHGLVEVSQISDYTGPIYKLRLTTPDGRILRLDNGEAENNPAIITVRNPCQPPAGRSAVLAHH